MEKFMLLRTDGTFAAVEIDPVNLSEIWAQLGPACDSFEIVLLVYDHHNYLAFVDEEGLYHSLDINPLASAVYPGMMYGNPIVGNVLIGVSGTRDGEPDIVGLSDPDLQHLSAALDLLHGALYDCSRGCYYEDL